MIIRTFTLDDRLSLELGSIEGTRKELSALQDAISALLGGSLGDERRHTRAVLLNAKQGLLVRKAAESNAL